MTPFQLIFTGVFAVFILVGVIFFSLSKGSSSGVVSNITIWGTLTPTEYSVLEKASGIYGDDTLNVTYVEINEASFDQSFIEALARGAGPDLVFISQDSVLKHRDKLFAIPYESYSERAFKESFIEEGELFLSTEGVVGLPFSVDPLVMYWNRTMFNNAGISEAPKYWDEFFNLASTFVVKDTSLNISQTSSALGEYLNVTNAKEILSALIMQAGGSVTVKNGEVVSSDLVNKHNETVVPSEAVLNYYTQFSNPSNSYYSWNRSLPSAQDFFVSGDSAIYFGFASELSTINLKNPNLNFDVSSFPQARGSNEILTYGKLTALSIPKTSNNIAAAFTAANMLSGIGSLTELENMTGLPPVRRGMLSNKPTNPSSVVFYNSALWSRGWYDPDKNRTATLFRNMIESVTSGRSSISTSVRDASTLLQTMLEGKSF